MIESDALQLRFRDDAATSAPPDIAAFLRAANTPSEPRSTEDIGVVPGARPVEPDGPIVVFLQQSEFGIPLPGRGDDLPDLDSWSVRPATFGWIATVSPPTRGAAPRRAVQVLAGCLALALPIPIALAAPPASPQVQAPAPAKATATQPAPTTPEPAPTTPEPAPTPAPQVEPQLKPPPPPPPPPLDQSRALADAAWEGIDGFVVNLELKGGKTLRGRVGAVQTDTFTLIDSSDGQIRVIPKSGVSSVRAFIPAPLPTQTGGGLIAGGSILAAIGVPLFITGITFVAICPSCIELHVPMLVVGAGALGGGIPMISLGMQRRTAMQRAMNDHRITPVVRRTPGNGWMGGLQFRF